MQPAISTVAAREFLTNQNIVAAFDGSMRAIQCYSMFKMFQTAWGSVPPFLFEDYRVPPVTRK
jgi:hypothetical protein